jgi:uncharacterized low-complexity protein
MKNLFSLVLLASTITSVALPALALDGENEAKTAAKNERRAEHQENKAQRDAAEGNVNGAAKHADDAARDEHKARHEEHKARRDGY